MTAASNQTVESTTEVQAPDSDDESQLAYRQRHDEVDPEISDAQSVSSELVGAN